MSPLALFDLVLPGSGLLIRGRLGAGLALILPTLGLLAAIGLISLLSVRGTLASSLVLPLGLYGALAVLALALHLILERPRPIDAEQVRARHRELAAAWLAGRDAEAMTAARALVAAAPAEPGAWRQLALVATGLGQSAVAKRAEARARRLALRRDEA